MQFSTVFHRTANGMHLRAINYVYTWMLLYPWSLHESTFLLSRRSRVSALRPCYSTAAGCVKPPFLFHLCSLGGTILSGPVQSAINASIEILLSEFKSLQLGYLPFIWGRTTLTCRTTCASRLRTRTLPHCGGPCFIVRFSYLASASSAFVWCRCLLTRVFIAVTASALFRFPSRLAPFGNFFVQFCRSLPAFRGYCFRNSSLRDSRRSGISRLYSFFVLRGSPICSVTPVTEHKRKLTFITYVITNSCFNRLQWVISKHCDGISGILGFWDSEMYWIFTQWFLHLWWGFWVPQIFGDLTCKNLAIFPLPRIWRFSPLPRILAIFSCHKFSDFILPQI